jgi:hypothetical protein
MYNSCIYWFHAYINEMHVSRSKNKIILSSFQFIFGCNWQHPVGVLNKSSKTLELNVEFRVCGDIQKMIRAAE